MNRIPSLPGPRGCAPARTEARAIQAGVLLSDRNERPADRDERPRPPRPCALVVLVECVAAGHRVRRGNLRSGVRSPAFPAPGLAHWHRSSRPILAAFGRALSARLEAPGQFGVSGRVVPSPRNPGPFRPRACACERSIQRTCDEAAARPAWGPPSYPFDARTPQGVVARGDGYRPRVRRAMRVHRRQCVGFRRGGGGA